MARTGIDRYIYSCRAELEQEFGGKWNLVEETNKYYWNIDTGYCVQYTMDSNRFVIINKGEYKFAATYKEVKKFIKIHHELRAFK